MADGKVVVWDKNAFYYKQNPTMADTPWITINWQYVPYGYNSYYYKYFEIPVEGTYTLYASFDDMGTININGTTILKDAGGKYGWKQTYKEELTLKKGGYVIEVYLTNLVNHSSTGFALKIVDSSGNKVLQTDATWKGYTTVQDWHNFIKSSTINYGIVNMSSRPSVTQQNNAQTTQTNTLTQSQNQNPYDIYYQYTYTQPTEMSFGSEIENIIKKYGIFIAGGLGLMLLLTRRE